MEAKESSLYQPQRGWTGERGDRILRGRGRPTLHRGSSHQEVKKGEQKEILQSRFGRVRGLKNLTVGKGELILIRDGHRWKPNIKE